MDQPGNQGPNADQARGWDGPEGDNWTENEDYYNRATRYLTPHLFSAASVGAADQVLDVGCGCGETTRNAARAARSGSAFGIDLSTRMIERARERADEEGLDNVRFQRGDAQVYAFEPNGFDVAISRFGSMFFDDPVSAFTNIARGLGRGGRVAMLVWRELGRNEWVSSIRDALAVGRTLPEPPPGVPSPFAFADENRIRTILDAAGFGDIVVEPVEEQMDMGPDALAAFDSVRKLGIVNGLLSELDERAQGAALEQLRRTIGDHETRYGVLFGSSAWLVRAKHAR